MPISVYRRQPVQAAPVALAAVRRRVDFPLLPHPPLEWVVGQRAEADGELEAARASGDVGRIKVARYHANWARKTELRSGTAPHRLRRRGGSTRCGSATA